jgi:hypothetical protein
MKTYRLDRTVFSIQSYKQSANRRDYWLSCSPYERLSAAWYLSCSVHNLNPEKNHRLNRTVFSMRKRQP